MSTIKQDWSWSDQFLPEIQRIVGPYLLEPAPLDRDRNEAADLIVLRAKNLTIACRIRRGSYSNKYANEITLRSRRESGTKTEYDKIIEGWGDWMLYGFAANDAEARIVNWSLIDLHAFKAHLIRKPQALRSGEVNNGDGTSFKWFDLHSFPEVPAILVGSSFNLQSKKSQQSAFAGAQKNTEIRNHPMHREKRN
jgi:hypothetical protein